MGNAYKVEIDLSELGEYITNLLGFDMSEIMEGVGAMVQGQSETRINKDKSSPDGTPWTPWSPRYAKSGKGIAMLERESRLINSINYQLKGGNRVDVGSNLRWAGTHQYGDNREVTRKTKDGGRSVPFNRNIPARPYLGVSDKNKTAIDDLVKAYLEDLAGGN